MTGIAGQGAHVVHVARRELIKLVALLVGDDRNAGGALDDERHRIAVTRTAVGQLTNLFAEVEPATPAHLEALVNDDRPVPLGLDVA